MPYIIILKVRKFQQPTANRFGTARQKPVGAQRVKGPSRGSSGTPPLMILGTIKASPMKLCTVIGLLKPCQNAKRNFQKSDL